MKRSNWKTYALWILLAEAVGGLSALLTRSGTKLFQTEVIQPAFTPPMWLFPVAWGILYALMGIGAARVFLTPPSEARSDGLRLFLVQLAVNFLWSIIFFNLQAYGFAFAWILLLLGLIIWMTVTFYQTDSLAAFLQIPYILWVAFASVLTFAVWRLNP